MGLVFNIVAKEKSVWVFWVNGQHIKTKRFWTMNCPKDCFWTLRNALKSRAITANFIRSRIANACLEHYISLDAKVTELLNNDQWNQHIDSVQDHELKMLILSTNIHSHLPEDTVVWTPSTSGKFSTKSAYAAISRTQQKRMVKPLMTNLRLQIPLVSKTVRYCIWSNPEEGKAKLNVDGLVSDSGAGIGGTIRLRNGVIVLAFSGSSNKESVFCCLLCMVGVLMEVEKVYVSILGAIRIWEQGDVSEDRMLVNQK
ncbi:hypothetical protein IFM89_014537 [Coptis chinensis]|uniref:RNase H type-1 domain-containing protein n=1 Tax=Coptis chinensis TaxID=261450 RepID=A0A835H5X7_9MAGN|nr:hypothetical protein IFM89_014537 [Coptis chinensis]